MSGSLKDQLIALGLAAEKKNKPKKPLRNPAKGAGRKQRKGEGIKAPSLETAYRLRNREERKQADAVGLHTASRGRAHHCGCAMRCEPRVFRVAPLLIVSIPNGRRV